VSNRKQSGIKSRENTTGVFDPNDLPIVVGMFLDESDFEIAESSVSQLQSGKGDDQVFRVSGTSKLENGLKAWSVILKKYTKKSLPQPWQAENWQRESMMYASGIFEDFPSGVRTPACFKISEDGQHVFLWLEEDLSDVYGAKWPLSAFRTAAHYLGALNSKFIGRNVDVPCLARHVLAQWTESAAASLRALSTLRSESLLQTVFDNKAVSQLSKVAEQRESYISTLDAMPQTLCHMDAFRRNLFFRQNSDGNEELVLIDWSHCGYGALGEELAALVGLSMFFFEAEPETLPVLDAISFASYLKGLTDSGVEAEKYEVRLAYTAANSLRLLSRTSFVINLALDAGLRPRWEFVIGRSASEIVQRYADMLPYMLATASEYEQIS
jgi:hypothetical protein